ncbi:hypothetical protein [Flammeovirga sp. SubArs3]|uniref:hypothetical protein n=1 Tax=Flammeovirga sp. SubArs3 TaxID=2995316 RepID=UPI00248BB10F|nr:hypothetical protein [Flammeovirga sp. SubArs3]
MNKASLWGHCDAILAATSLPKKILRKLLPDTIDFTSQNYTSGDDHPVIYMFNEQVIHIFFSFFKVKYKEMIPLIPFVHFKDNPSVNYQTSPILYVDSLLIVFGGQVMWHLNKVIGKFMGTSEIQHFSKMKYLSHKVFRENIETITMTATPTGEVGTIDDFPYCKQLSELWHTGAIINNETTFWTARYEVIDKSVQGAAVNIQVKDIEGLPSQTLDIPPIQENILGGFQLTFDWKLWWPKKYQPIQKKENTELLEELSS